MKIRIELIGCDDTTKFDMEITQEQYEFLNEISKESKMHSEYSCMPTMEVGILEDED